MRLRSPFSSVAEPYHTITSSRVKELLYSSPLSAVTVMISSSMVKGTPAGFVVTKLIKPAHAAAKIRFTADGVHRVLRRRDQDVRLRLPARHSASQPKAGKRRREQQNRARRSQNKPANVPFFRRLLCERRFRRAAAQPLHGEEIEFQNLRKALDGVQVGISLPLSQREMFVRETASRSASCSCVSPFALRTLESCVPNDSTSAPLFIT